MSLRPGIGIAMTVMTAHLRSKQTNNEHFTYGQHPHGYFVIPYFCDIMHFA